MKQAFNPYLPNYEYVPDGEPHVFDGRLYVFGSHDRFGGKKFSMNDYVAWSCPVDDLSDWRCEGVIYKKTQDPANRDGEKSMYAPDVARGPDGRYYLYYGLADQFKCNVAVCDTPAGAYEFYGFVSHPDGVPWGEREGDIMPFDPGVLVDDDGRVRLRGRAKGVLYVYDEAKREMPAAAIPVGINNKEWSEMKAPLRVRGSRTPLFFLWRGRGALDMFSFTLQ